MFRIDQISYMKIHLLFVFNWTEYVGGSKWRGNEKKKKMLEVWNEEEMKKTKDERGLKWRGSEKTLYTRMMKKIS